MATAKKIKAYKTDSELIETSEFTEDPQFKYWKSSLFNDVYLRTDLQTKYTDLWQADGLDGFEFFMNTLRDLAADYADQEKYLKNWSETETINNWIKHVLTGLGWANKRKGKQEPYLEETSFNFEGKTYRTDILIVDEPSEIKYILDASKDEKIIEARKAVLIPVEAKYWRRLEKYRQSQQEDKKRTDKKEDDISRTSSPDEQILKYMEVLQTHWGILTDGATWRLFNKEISGEDCERYYEFNLFALIQQINTAESDVERDESINAAKYFYFFFNKQAIHPQEESNESFLNEILSYSKRYVNKIEEDLKGRFVKAMNHACNGLYVAAKKAKMTDDLVTIRNVAESTLFNILFIKSLESRNVLPMNAVDYRKISLSSLIDKIEKYDPEKQEDPEINLKHLKRAFKKGNGNSFDFEWDGTQLHDRIIDLTKVIHDGQSKQHDFGFEIAGFKESIFSDDEWKLFNKCKLSNESWVKILFELGYADSDIKGLKYQQIPYSYFTPRQLGSIYESFLEFQIDKADENMVFEKKQWKNADLKSQKYKNTSLPVVKKGELFFTPDNKDRKATGSYYTPDYIVQYIVKETIGDQKGKSAKEILELKVCDPAMGSGHFLVGALRHLTSLYLKALADEAEGDLKITLQEAKRRVLDACIFGVDINPRAVKLAKMSLWLESAHENYKLEQLDDQLSIADSLINKKIWPKYNQLQNSGFSVIIGNPPWLMAGYIDSLNTTKLKEFYKSAEGKFDLYYLFIELAISLISKEGKIGLIVPNKFFHSKSGVKIRELINDTKSLYEINDFGTEQLFKGATNYSTILFFDNKKRKNIYYKKLTSNLDLDLEVTINPDFFTQKQWDFESMKFKELLAKIQNKSVRLESKIERFGTGVQSGADKIFLLNKTQVTTEKKLLVPFLRGRDIRKYQPPVADKLLIFPYKNPQENILIAESELKMLYPNTYNHLSTNKNKLQDRIWFGKNATELSGNWYGLMYFDRIENFEKPHILSPCLSNISNFTLGNGNFFANGTAGIVSIIPKETNDLFFLLGYLNSSLVSFYMRLHSPCFQGGYYKFSAPYLKNIPIPEINKREKKLISDYAEQAMSNSQNFNELLRKIDEIIYNSFSLTKNEIIAIESTLNLNQESIVQNAA